MKRQRFVHPGLARFARRSLILLGGAALSAVVLFASAAWSQGGPAKDHPPVKLKIADSPVAHDGAGYSGVVRRVLPSVVSVEVSKPAAQVSWSGPDLPFLRKFFDQDPNGSSPSPRPFRSPPQQGAGSGVVVTEDGYILTNNHVVEDADTIRVKLSDGREFEAETVGRDPQTDIAVLRIRCEDLPAVTLSDSDTLEVGDVVLAIGNPFGLGQTVTSGIVSAKGRATLGLDYEDFIQTDAAINPGNSGGALIDVEGRLVGINTAILSRSGGNQGIGFAVPTNLARWVMEQLVDSGTVERGFLGVMIQDLNPELARAFDLRETQGALIADVTPGSPADKAGLKSGDVITEYNGKPVQDSRRLKLAVGATPPGGAVSVRVIRDGKSREFDVALKSASDPKVAGKPRAGHAPGEALAGVGVANLDTPTREQLGAPRVLKGAVVTQVEEGSAAYAAGLRQGDVITEINRNDIADADAAVAACEKAEPATLVKIWRDGGSRYLVVDESRAG